VNEPDLEVIASISKSMAMMCVRNTMPEELPAVIEPISRTGDFTDVVVIDANGRDIPCLDVLRIGDEEMGHLRCQVVNRLYTFQAKADNLHFVAMMDPALAEAWRGASRGSMRKCCPGLRRAVGARKKGTKNAIRDGSPGKRNKRRHRKLGLAGDAASHSHPQNRCCLALADTDRQRFEFQRFRNALAWVLPLLPEMRGTMPQNERVQTNRRFEDEANTSRTSSFAPPEKRHNPSILQSKNHPR